VNQAKNEAWEIWGEPGTRDLAVGPKEGGVAIAQVVMTTGTGFLTEDSARKGNDNAARIAMSPVLEGALREILEAAEKAVLTEQKLAALSVIEKFAEQTLIRLDALRASLEEGVTS
jgi:DNA-directed RNA polymerase beta' subunit